MDLVVQSKGPLILTPAEFLASGGQGSVYAKGTLAYKIYHDPTKMMPVAKVNELSAIKNPDVLRPLDILLDKNGKPVGYSMRFIKKTIALCQLFPKAYRDREHLTPTMILNLVRKLQGIVSDVHAAGHRSLIVDLNEMNFLINDKHTEIYAIDTDSYQTTSFPPTAIMESIRDRHSKPNHFDQGTDWFSFAVTAFQMFIGIHPYKGRHPTIDGMDARMLANISVLNPAVSFPKGATQPFSVIPQEYINWFSVVLDRGDRVAPPNALGVVVVISHTVTRVKGSQHFDIKEVFTLPESIVNHFVVGSARITLTTDALYIAGKKVCKVGGQTHIGVSRKMLQVIACSVDNGKLNLHNSRTNSPLELDLEAEGITSYNGYVYFKNGSKMYEIDFFEMANGRIVPSAKPVANIHPLATKVFDGIVTQTLFSKTHINFFPESGMNVEMAIPEITGQIVDAKYDNGIVMIVAVDTKGKYNRYVLRFDSTFSTYEIFTIAKDINYSGLNFVVLDNGVCCMMNEAGEIELIRNKKGDPTDKVIPDKQLDGDIRLFKEGTTVMFAKGDSLNTMTLKK